jgi:hypothetical protein
MHVHAHRLTHRLTNVQERVVILHLLSRIVPDGDGRCFVAQQVCHVLIVDFKEARFAYHLQYVTQWFVSMPLYAICTDIYMCVCV